MKVQRTAPLVAGILVYLFIGLIYAWSIFAVPLEAEFGWTRTQTSATFTITIVCFSLGGLFSGLISKWKSAKFIIRIAAILLLTGFTLSSRVETVLELYIFYGIFCGFGVGLAYNTGISTVTKWFPDKMGLVSGVLLMGYGFGGMLLGSFASILMPEYGWRNTFIILGIVSALILFVFSTWIVPPEKDAILPEVEMKNIKSKEEGLSLVASEMVKRPSFWFYFIWVMIMTVVGLAVIGQATMCAQDIGATVKIATIITGIISICNGVGRILYGFIFDSLGRKFCIRFNNFVMIIAFLALILANYYASIPVFIIGGIFLGLSFGGLSAINSAFINMFYGSENYAMNFSIINCSSIPASILGPLTAAALKTATGTYLSVFILLLCLSVAAFGIQFFIKRP